MKGDLSGLDLVELLGQLQEIPTPRPISLWPETEAWVWLGMAATGMAAWLIRRMLLRRRSRAYRRAAMREIARSRESPAALAAVLRRTALAAFPRERVAGLYGEEWLAFLDRTGHLGRAGEGTDFREGAGRAFAQAAYSPTFLQANQSKPLALLAARWVRRHRVDGEAGA